MSKKKNKAKKLRPAQLQEVQQSVRESQNGRKKSYAIITVPFLVLVVSVVLFWQFKGTSLHTGEFKNYNVLLITIDTLRADHLPAYGYSGVKAPYLDRISSESMKFVNAFAHAPLTLPSHTSILTGRLPISHGVRDNAGYHLDNSETTLAEILKSEGYTTGAFVSSFILDSVFNLQQGFDFYFDNFDTAEFQGMDPRAIERRADETEAAVEQWLDQNSKNKFFAWVHFYDPHDPYNPPEPYKSEYQSKPYDGEIAYTDSVLGKLIAKLESNRLMDRTILIITGDHGEGLGEHREPHHGLFIYNSTIHVPLLIRLPDAKGKTIDDLIRHIDLAPTVLDFLGFQVPGNMQGASLIPLINGEEKKERLAYSESLYASLHYGWASLEGITSKKYKYIQAPRPELFDLNTDFSESTNIATKNGPLARAMNSELQEIITKYTNKNVNAEKAIDPDVEEKLRSLGYIGTQVPKSRKDESIDPKDKVHIAAAVQEAAGAALLEDYPLALRLIEPVIQEQPNMSEALYIAGVSHAFVGNYDKAIDYLLQTIALSPGHAMAEYNLGAAYLTKNDLKQAEYWLKKVVAASPKLMNAQLKLGQVYMMQKKPDMAAPHFAVAVKFYEDSIRTSGGTKNKSDLYASLAEIQFSSGDSKNAEVNLQKAIELEPSKRMLHYNLAQVYESLNQKDSAIREYEAEMKIDPTNFRAFTNAGILYYEARRLDDAARCFQKSVELNPADSRGYLQLATVYKMMGKHREAEDLLRVVKQRSSTN
ncbi:MAG TPA: sulfatase-like hydrolase/transferase [Acidobacteriota bacterium]|nr:sulfatase-like hydrolase/transferase [Acidobacteriota bacterium]